MATDDQYEISNYTVYPHCVSAQVIHSVLDEEGKVLRSSSFRAEPLDAPKMQGKANERGANASNKLSWHDADVEEATQQYLTLKRYNNPCNVRMKKQEEQNGV